MTFDVLFSDSENKIITQYYNTVLYNTVLLKPNTPALSIDPVIIENKEPKQISEISGIPVDWTRSMYNYKKTAQESMKELLVNNAHCFNDLKHESFNHKHFLLDERLDRYLLLCNL